MSDVYVFQLAAQNARWLSQRESLISSNVANASTPGYRAKDMLPFSAILDSGQVGLSVTNGAHLTLAGATVAEGGATEMSASEETLSGNSVNLEQQMMNLGEVNRAYSLNTNIKRALHQMMMSVLK